MEGNLGTLCVELAGDEGSKVLAAAGDEYNLSVECHCEISCTKLLVIPCCKSR